MSCCCAYEGAEVSKSMPARTGGGRQDRLPCGVQRGGEGACTRVAVRAAAVQTAGVHFATQCAPTSAQLLVGTRALSVPTHRYRPTFLGYHVGLQQQQVILARILKLRGDPCSLQSGAARSGALGAGRQLRGPKGLSRCSASKCEYAMCRRRCGRRASRCWAATARRPRP